MNARSAFPARAIGVPGVLRDEHRRPVSFYTARGDPLGGPAAKRSWSTSHGWRTISNRLTLSAPPARWRPVLSGIRSGASVSQNVPMTSALSLLLGTAPRMSRWFIGRGM